MPDDNESLDFEDRLEKAEHAALDDVKDIKALKAEMANLRKNVEALGYNL